MMKSLCTLVHKPGTTREAFQHYYEESHAPLAIRYFPFTRYVRNHLLDSDDIGFDTISEFWAKDTAALAEVSSGPVGEIMRADEEKFMDRARIAQAGAGEHVLSAGVPMNADGLRTALLIDGDGAMADIALDWATELAADMPGVSLDITTAYGEPVFPASAVLWLPGTPAIGRAPSRLQIRRLLVRRCETPREQLLAMP